MLPPHNPFFTMQPLSNCHAAASPDMAIAGIRCIPETWHIVSKILVNNDDTMTIFQEQGVLPSCVKCITSGKDTVLNNRGKKLYEYVLCTEAHTNFLYLMRKEKLKNCVVLSGRNK